MASDQVRTYDRASSVVFLKTDAPFGGLSNMAGGFPLHVQGTRIYTSEALYQACRFPHLPEVQRLIIGQASPMTAKMKSKPHRKDSRPDWDRVRVKVMRWCLRVKLAQNWPKFSELLLRTGDRSIVEESRRDDFWGAKPVDEQTLVGMNVLGRLLMELREAIKTQGHAAFRTVEPPDLPEFLLFGRPIGAIGESGVPTRGSAAAPAETPADRRPIQKHAAQASLFDAPPTREAPALARTAAVASRGDLKPYPAMKDSGVPWLGEVPVHWEVRKLKYAVSFSGGGTPSKAEASFWGGRIPWVSPKDMTRARIADSMDHITEEAVSASATSIVSPGALLMVVRSGILRRTIPVAINAVEVALNQDMKALRPRAGVVASDYLRALVQGNERALIQEWTKQGATVESIEHEFLANSRVPLPPLPEQAAIVRFLDHADQRIRRYIRAKQKLIKLLEEQKQAIIHRAVTRGLDPNVRLKPSGVEWLGDVPEHWEVRKLRQCGSIYGGLTPSMADRSLWDGDVPWVTPKDMKRFTIAGASMKVSARALETTSLRLIPSGSVLLVVRGMILARRVPIARTVEPVTINQDMKAIVPATGVDAGYLAYRMDAAQTAFVPMIDEAGHGTKRFPTERWKDLSLAMPPVEEQRQIARHLDQATAQVVRALNSAQHEIDLLREYRTRLIADVVTGKLDVREAAARLPDEAEELEPVDEIEAEGDTDEARADETDQVPAEVEA